MNEERLYKMFKYEHPETVGEKDQCFDTNNYKDWLQKYVGKLEAKLLTMKLSEEIPFKIIKTNEKCCANCKGENTGGFAWVYCELRKDNDEKFDDDCGELLGCNHFNRALDKKEKELKD